MSSKFRRFIDIGANLTDLMYTGVYHGKFKHENDLQMVLERSWSAGLEKIIITAGSVEESRKALQLARSDDRLFCTVGCHPTRCNEFLSNPKEYLNSLDDLIRDGGSKVVALGECGLDYDRLEFCPKTVQQQYLQEQLKLLEKHNLPVFLHCRNAADDLYRILSEMHVDFGIVHSFDGTLLEAERFINDLQLFIGINGCSFKREENLRVVAQLPIDRVLLETDCPWCEIRTSHAGFKYIKNSEENDFIKSVKKEKWTPDCMVKGRTEPCSIQQVFQVLCSLKTNQDPDDLCRKIYQNTLKLFWQ